MGWMRDVRLREESRKTKAFSLINWKVGMDIYLGGENGGRTRFEDQMSLLTMSGLRFLLDL